MTFVAVETPSKENGSANLDYIYQALTDIAENLEEDHIVVIKSTVPVGSSYKFEAFVQKKLADLGKKIKIHFASNPEFLREGSAINDFMEPDRIVVELSESCLQKYFWNFTNLFIEQDLNRLLFVERPASEMIKYAANTMLATRGYMNELSVLCDSLGVDIDDVRKGLGSDSRWDLNFLSWSWLRRFVFS